MDLLVPARQAHDLPVQGRGLLLVGARRRQGRRGRGLELSRAARGRAAAGRLLRLLLEQDGRVARGGRARDRARARPLPPDRRPRHLAPRARQPWTARRVADTTRGARAVRDRPAAALVLPARGRAARPARGRPTRAPAAPTRALRPTGRSATRTTSCGPIPSRATRPTRIRDYLAFFNERVDIEVDGELQERPVTQWSKSRRSRRPPPLNPR